MKNTRGQVAHPSFFLASTTGIVGAPSMTQLYRGMDGTAPPVEDIAFRVLAADNQPNLRTDFRQDPFETMERLFEEALKIALDARALKVGRVALGGTKIKPMPASTKAISNDRMKREEGTSVRRSKICWRRRKRMR